MFALFRFEFGAFIKTLFKCQIFTNLNHIFILNVPSQECCRRFPVHIPGLESLVKTEKFQLHSTSSQTDQIKISATLSGDNICYAVIYFRLACHLFCYLFSISF